MEALDAAEETQYGLTGSLGVFGAGWSLALTGIEESSDGYGNNVYIYITPEYSWEYTGPTITAPSFNMSGGGGFFGPGGLPPGANPSLQAQSQAARGIPKESGPPSLRPGPPEEPPLVTDNPLSRAVKVLGRILQQDFDVLNINVSPLFVVHNFCDASRNEEQFMEESNQIN